MQALREFLIPFKGLKTGVHRYHFLVSNEFFKSFQPSQIEAGEFEVVVALDKRPGMMILELEFNGHLVADCDRCLNEIRIPMDGDHRVMIKISEDPISEDEMVSISPVEFELQVAPFIYEMIHLNLPLRKVRDCKNEGYRFCNVQILEAIDRQNPEEHSNSAWDELKKLKF